MSLKMTFYIRTPQLIFSNFAAATKCHPILQFPRNSQWENLLVFRWYQPLRWKSLGLVLISIRYFILGLASLFF